MYRKQLYTPACSFQDVTCGLLGHCPVFGFALRDNLVHKIIVCCPLPLVLVQ